MRLIFRADASPAIGGGHVMRCLTLADALAEAGHDCRFVCAEITEPLADLVRDLGHALARIDPGDGDLLADADRTLDAIGDGKADWIVVDHYRLDSRWEAMVRPAAASILVIDDLADRPHDCDLLLDQIFGRNPGDYRHWVPTGCRVLAGPLYALLRPQFAEAREAALEKQSAPGEVGDIFLSFGATDLGGITGRILPRLLPATPTARFHVAVGRSAPSLCDLEAMAADDTRIRLHVDSDDLAALMARCDLAVGAAGTMSWERCCLALPSIALALADNQRFVADRLAMAGAQVSTDEAGLPAALAAMANDAELRASLSAAAAAITDGLGTRRVIDAMTGANLGTRAIDLRDAGPSDRRSAWLWRNDPVTRAVSQSHEPIPWAGHCRWWDQALTDPERIMTVAEVDGEPAALVRFDPVAGGGHEVGINLAPEVRGLGLGGAILAAAIDRFDRFHGKGRLDAVIHQGNVGSRKIFERLGFSRTGPLGEAGFERYVRG